MMNRKNVTYLLAAGAILLLAAGVFYFIAQTTPPPAPPTPTFPRVVGGTMTLEDMLEVLVEDYADEQAKGVT